MYAEKLATISGFIFAISDEYLAEVPFAFVDLIFEIKKTALLSNQHKIAKDYWNKTPFHFIWNFGNPFLFFLTVPVTPNPWFAKILNNLGFEYQSPQYKWYQFDLNSPISFSVTAITILFSIFADFRVNFIIS
ncbi:unnamed protein product [Blepharisma stoltei]|uniref:Uncharacterized protein n=1 Tax=Blepharisma stoltei TaxID=1481888 RepID=A0AAU9IV71_9CILI|nr:unnamed protein product [Blepharisma stoltei]